MKTAPVGTGSNKQLRVFTEAFVKLRPAQIRHAPKVIVAFLGDKAKRVKEDNNLQKLQLR